jgi:hypothetical protein
MENYEHYKIASNDDEVHMNVPRPLRARKSFSVVQAPQEVPSVLKPNTNRLKQ